MDATVARAVERAIGTMRKDLGYPLTLDDLARSAMFSKFHFLRVFQQATGTSPVRFLSAMRVAEAKRLLATTSLTIADISYQVGYNSVGTFSARFHESVGMPPSVYRRNRGAVGRRWREPAGTAPATSVITGRIAFAPESSSAPVFVGLFTSRIAEGTPACHTIVDGPGRYVLTGVPAGTWHVIALSMTRDSIAAYGPLPVPEPARDNDDRVPVEEYDPTAHSAAHSLSGADLVLRPKRLFDPPVLLALP